MTRERPPALRWSFVLALLAVASCGQLPADSVTSSAPIYGGAADPGDEAVMALVNQMGRDSTHACTGTTIAKVGASGIYLTAAHCVVATDANNRIITPLQVATPDELYVIPGPDWITSVSGNLYYGTTAVAVHPQYDGQINSPYDMALVRYVGATATTPVIPVVTPAEDATFTTGSKFTLVGFGKTETNDMNSQRRKVDRVVETISAGQFLYDQRDIKGACQGDSGGPALVMTAGGLRVVGVTSFGDTECTNLGVSVRVGPMASFIQAFVAAAPATLSCADCTQAAVAPGNACVAQSVACGDDATPCGKFLACAGACTTNACVNSCRQSQSAGSAAYDAMVVCQCNGACAPACRTNQSCSAYITTTLTCRDVTSPAGPACTSCLQGTCCTETAACASDATCADCMRSAGASCRTNTLFAKLNTCTATCSGAPCSGAPATTPDAGAVDAGASEVGPRAGGGDGGGCGCAVAAPSAPGALSLALAGLLSTLIRRRRR
jgi:MYXO-CTERM domain-containing protein